MGADNQDLPQGISIVASYRESRERNVSFDIDREGQHIAFDLSEAEAVGVALAILKVGIQGRSAAGRPRWRPRVLSNANRD